MSEREFSNGLASAEGGLTLKEARALFKSVDENGDGTMDQMEFISLMESKHPLLKKIPWARELQASLGEDGSRDDVWVDPDARYLFAERKTRCPPW